MLVVENLWKYFEEKVVLEDINATFESEKINMIIGKSGSGKTVLLKCIVGLLTPEKGSIYFDGRNFTTANRKLKKQIRQEIGLLFQGGALFDSLTVLENIMFPLEMFTELNYEQRREIAFNSLHRVKLYNVENKYPAELSGGMKKRVALARAIVNKPRYLFFDEPNSGLDPLTARAIDELIIEIAKDYQTTTIINTHDIKSVMTMGEKIIFIHKGKKWWEGNKEEMFNSKNTELLNFLNASGYTV